MATLVDRLSALARLHAQGMLTDQEFSQAKSRVLSQAPAAVDQPGQQTATPEPARRRSPPPALNPTVAGVGLGLAAGGVGLGG